jgi:AraC-like DNA-binding protein
MIDIIAPGFSVSARSASVLDRRASSNILDAIVHTLRAVHVTEIVDPLPWRAIRLASTRGPAAIHHPRVLIARGHLHIGRGNLRWALVFAPRLWCVVVRRTGLVLDTRCVAAATDPPRPMTCVYLLLEGVFEIHGEPGRTLEAPCALVLTDEQLEGADGARSFQFRAAGEPFSAIELHFAAGDVMVAPSAEPEPFALDAEAWRAALAVAAFDDDETVFRRKMNALLECIAGSGHVAGTTAACLLDQLPRPFELLWRAVGPMIERFCLVPTLQEVGDAAGVSVRQVDRFMQEFVARFGLVGQGFRQTTRHVRLKLAVLLLSADDATIADVASTVGYLSSDAMARAFRDAGLPAPTKIQQLLRAHR